MVVKPLLIVLVALLVGAAVAQLAEARALHRARSPSSVCVHRAGRDRLRHRLRACAWARSPRPRARAFFDDARHCTPTTSAACSSSPTRCCCSPGGRPSSQALKTVAGRHDGPARRFALLLTFSRGAFLGFLLVNALFLLWKFNAKTARRWRCSATAHRVLLAPERGLQPHDLRLRRRRRQRGERRPHRGHLAAAAARDAEEPAVGQRPGLDHVVATRCRPAPCCRSATRTTPTSRRCSTWASSASALLLAFFWHVWKRLPRAGQQRLPQPRDARLLPGRRARR